MRKLLLASAAGLLLAGVSGPALSATAEECQAKFEAADVNKDGALKLEEATLFVEAVTKAQIQLKEASVISRDEFASACEKDVFANVTVPAAGQTTAAAPDASGQATTTDQTAATTQGAAEQPAATTDQSAATTTTEPSATDQSASTTTTQPSTTDQSAATTTTTDPSASTTTVQPSTTDQSAAATDPAATTDQSAATTAPETTDPAATGEQTAATEQPSADQSATTGTQALAPPQGFLASKLIGSTVYTKDDQSIGDINDVIVAQDAGQADGIIVGIGGFLGIGEKNVLLDMSKLTFVPTDDGGAKIVLDTTKTELETMPAYEGTPQQ